MLDGDRLIDVYRERCTVLVPSSQRRLSISEQSDAELLLGGRNIVVRQLVYRRNDIPGFPLAALDGVLVVLDVHAWVVVCYVKLVVGINDWLQSIDSFEDGSLASLVLADQTSDIADVELTRVPHRFE